MVNRIVIVPFATVLMVSSLAAAQGLADVARAEEARRKAVKAPAKVYTNETLGSTAGREPPPAPMAPAPAAPSTTAKPAAAPAVKAEAPASADDTKDEKYWRDRITSARTELKRSQAFFDALQSQINGLYTEFVNMADPAQRAVIEQKRLAAVAEQDRLKTEIAKLTKTVADIEDEARRASVPPGWLR
jgi:hypothetical protein